MYLTLDGQGELHRQLLRALRKAICEGRLDAGAKLPATRELAEVLHISRNTVLAAYDLLRAEGMAVSRPGSGTYVSSAHVRTQAHAPITHAEAPSRYASRLRELPPLPLPMPRDGIRIDLQYGEAMTNIPLLTAWGRSLSHAAARAEVRYPRVQGLPALRTEIARYLTRRRAMRCGADDVIVVNGAQQAFSLLARVLLNEGDQVVMEDPSYALARQCFVAHGARVEHVAVDDAGLDARDLPSDTVKVVVVTPSHQFPLGVSMSLPRRTALVQHAAQIGSWIVEDDYDYDCDFGFDGRMLPALHSLDAHGRVIYVGTFSKTISPGLRLGYIVCPRALRSDLVLAKRLSDIASCGIEQHALAHFISSGAYERHLRRTALELRRRRHALLDGLAIHCRRRVEIHNSGAGMHLVAWFPGLTASDIEDLIVCAERRGLGLHAVTRHYASPPATVGLLLGFANASVPQLQAATRILGECLDRLSNGAPHAVMDKAA